MKMLWIDEASSKACVSGCGTMSLYEVLDRFVATGVLACAGLVGADIDPTSPLDGAEFSTRLRSGKLNEPFGAALDALAHTLWFANERQGIPLAAAEHHAATLSALLGEVRFAPGEIAKAFTTARGQPGTATSAGPSTPGSQLAELWLEKASSKGALARTGLDLEISRFLMSEMLTHVIDRTPLLSTLAPAIAEHRTALATAKQRPQPATPSLQTGAPQATASPGHEAALSNLSRPRPVLVAPPPPTLPAATATAEVQARHRLPEGALRRLQQILAQQPMSAEQRLARLDELGAWLIATVAYLRKPTNDAPAQRQAKLDAAAALEHGDFEQAMEFLRAVREHTRDGRRRVEARIAEELQSLRQQMIEEAAATSRLGELALARMDLDSAADHFADAAGQLPASEGALELDYRQKQAEALAAKAETTGDARALQASAHAFRKCRSLLTTTTEPRTRTRINVGLGDMLTALAARHPSETIELEEAITAYADAITAVDRATKPMQWALVKLSHAAALIELGRRFDRHRHWTLAATVLMPALEVFESRNAMDLAEAARTKLRDIADGIAGTPAQGLLSRPA